MILQLNLPPELAERLRVEAERRGQPTEAVALQLLDQYLPRGIMDPAAAVALLQTWIEEDDALSDEEESENQDVLRALDEDRPSYRRLFPELRKEDPQ